MAPAMDGDLPERKEKSNKFLSFYKPIARRFWLAAG